VALSIYADFEPIGMVASAKVNAEKLNVAHAGVGSITHFTCLLLNSLLGVKSTLVPFNGAAPAVNALLAGQVDCMCCTIPEVVQQAQSGTLKAYTVGTAQRNPTLPNVPTSKEAGLPEFQASAWNALFTPKGTPKAVLDKFTEALDKALDDETVRKRLLDLGCCGEKPRLREASASEPSMKCRKRIRRCQNRGLTLPPGSARGNPEVCPSGIRHVDGAKLNQAFVRNVRTCPPMQRERLQAAKTARIRVPMRSTGTEQLVLGMKAL
jgi:hypothetical protein